MFLAIDFEGTHREPRKGCPIQLGIALMTESGEVLDQDEWLIQPPLHYKTKRPTKEVDAYALRVSGLTLEQVEQGLTARESCQRLKVFVTRNNVKDLQTVAYNFTYDAEMLGQMQFEAGHYDPHYREFRPHPDILGHQWVCAYRLAKRKLPNLPNHTLEEVAKYFGLQRTAQTHGALEDAILAGNIYARLQENKEVL
jgi:DNA polymerase III epsilon subunit-like protein